VEHALVACAAVLASLQNPEFRFWGLGFGVWGLGFRFIVYGLWLIV
jgi:hypothetical protein